MNKLSLSTIAMAAAIGFGSPSAFAVEPIKPTKPIAETSSPDPVLKGIVVIQRAGKPVGLGTILSKDGRVLTALTAIGTGNDVSIRYFDGSVVSAKLHFHNRAWDLALLNPERPGGSSVDYAAMGLIASTQEPLNATTGVRSVTTLKSKPSLAPITLKAYRTLLGGDDAVLENVLDIASVVSIADMGAPILDASGGVVGVLARGCVASGSATTPCAATTFGVPIHAIKNFLKLAPPLIRMAAAPASSPKVP